MITTIDPAPRILRVLTITAVVMFVAALAMALFFAPTDSQGQIQRIFYMHLGAFMGGSLAFFDRSRGQCPIFDPAAAPLGYAGFSLY